MPSSSPTLLASLGLLDTVSRGHRCALETVLFRSAILDCPSERFDGQANDCELSIAVSQPEHLLQRFGLSPALSNTSFTLVYSRGTFGDAIDASE